MKAPSLEKTSRILSTVIPYARGLFRRYGYKKTTVDEIAAGVHISKKTLYAVFPSKEILLKETLWRDTVLSLKAFDTTITPDAQPDTMLLSFCRFIYNDRIKNGKDGYYWGLYADDDEIVSASRDALKRVIKAIYDEGVRKGFFKPVDSSFAAEVVVTIISSTLATFHLSYNPAKVFNDALDMAMDAVAHRKRVGIDASI